jgi:hypothetical protein
VLRRKLIVFVLLPLCVNKIPIADSLRICEEQVHCHVLLHIGVVHQSVLTIEVGAAMLNLI